MLFNVALEWTTERDNKVWCDKSRLSVLLNDVPRPTLYRQQSNSSFKNYIIQAKFKFELN